MHSNATYCYHLHRRARDGICAPSGVCDSACDSVGYCAGDTCESAGADSAAVYAACVVLCNADESWAASVNTAMDTDGCTGALTAYSTVSGASLPDGCPP